MKDTQTKIAKLEEDLKKYEEIANRKNRRQELKQNEDSFQDNKYSYSTARKVEDEINKKYGRKSSEKYNIGSNKKLTGEERQKMQDLDELHRNGVAMDEGGGGDGAVHCPHLYAGLCRFAEGFAKGGMGVVVGADGGDSLHLDNEQYRRFVPLFHRSD